LKTIFTYLRDFLKVDFDAPVYLLSIVILLTAIFFNYKYDFEDSILDSYTKEPISFLYYSLYFGFAYFYVIAIYLLFKRELPNIRSQSFWIISLLFIFLLAFKKSFWWGADWISSDLTKTNIYFYRKIIFAAKPVFIYTVGVILVYKCVDRVKSKWYGLTALDFDWRPYTVMLLLMIPFIAVASTQVDFLSSYPRLKMKYFQADYWSYFLMYEPFYLGGFALIEWLFRGLLVIGMIRFLGHRAILPAATIYCVFHFGKPAGEAISSFFGGYFLGVFAYYSRSIWGGIMVHMGIALMMDVGAIIGAYFIL